MVAKERIGDVVAHGNVWSFRFLLNGVELVLSHDEFLHQEFEMTITWNSKIFTEQPSSVVESVAGYMSRRYRQLYAYFTALTTGAFPDSFSDDELQDFESISDLITDSERSLFRGEWRRRKLEWWEPRDDEGTIFADGNGTFGYVYIIYVPTGHYKVGYSQYLGERLKHFSVQMPFEIELIHSFPCDDALNTEGRLHKWLKQHHVQGEWFSIPEDKVIKLKRIKKVRNHLIFLQLDESQ